MEGAGDGEGGECRRAAVGDWVNKVGEEGDGARGGRGAIMFRVGW